MAEPTAEASQPDAAGSGALATPGAGDAAGSGPSAGTPAAGTEAGSAAADELQHKQQQLNSLALAFLTDPGNMQRAFAAAHNAAKSGDESSLKAVYAAAQLARQLEVRL